MRGSPRPRANAGAPCGSRRATGRTRRANAWAGPATAKPIWNTNHVSRITPPTRTTPTRGPPTCDIPIVASGIPPNGNENRTASARAWAAGRPITRQAPIGARVQPPHGTSRRRTPRRGSPARSVAPSNPCRGTSSRPRTGIRVAAADAGSGHRRASTSNRTTPRIASGQNPHGGIDNATSVPAPRASAGRARRSRSAGGSGASRVKSPVRG